MCGRYDIKFEDFQSYQDYLDYRRQKTNLETKQKEVIPSQETFVVVEENGEPKIKKMIWGFSEHRSEKNKFKGLIINVDAQTIEENGYWKKYLESSQRCLVIADGYYEWKNINKQKKEKFRISLNSGFPFVMAGLWATETNQKTGRPENKFGIITTHAADEIKSLHLRMPFILNEKEEQFWLGNTEIESLKLILKNIPGSKLKTEKMDDQISMFE